ncbi:hypothetical protein GCM10009579_42660 [Streptomyces javensis]|uniref:Uncharacterized protein n=1 Tax=Streptomyces javensis TaxID=114698 RepID=A0ABP4HS01_9ACTN
MVFAEAVCGATAARGPAGHAAASMDRVVWAYQARWSRAWYAVAAGGQYVELVLALDSRCPAPAAVVGPRPR